MRRHRRGVDVDHGDNMSIPLRPQTAPESVKADELHEVVSNEVFGRYLQRIGVTPTKLKRTSSSTRTHATRLLSSLYFKANIAELRKRMPIQRTNVNATFKSKGGFNDEVNVQLPKMRSRARSVVDPLKRASEVLSTSYLETYENLEGTAGKTAIRTAGGRLVKPGKRTNNLAVEQVYGRGE